MFCLKCGTATGSDQEFCDRCADDPVTDQSLKAVAEEKEAKEEADVMRCPACNQRVLDNLTNCPSCGAHLVSRARISD
jgi:DNA-directed RNA polymerase subunit RPC12/RpoP